MAIDYVLFSGQWARSTEPLSHPQANDDSIVYAHVSTSVTLSAKTAGSTSTAVDELDSALKVGAVYSFEYNLIYSISGLAVGAQFGIAMLSGGVDSIGYSVMMAANGTSLQSVATTTVGTLIGSGSSFSGGGPWSCLITGAMKVSSASDPVARLMIKGSGIGVSVTLQTNSSAYFQEV